MNQHQRYKTGTFVCLSFTAIFLCCVFLIPLVIERQSYADILKQNTLRRENYEDWGKYPGTNNIGLQKHYSLFTVLEHDKFNDTKVYIEETKKFDYDMILNYDSPEYVANTNEQIKMIKNFQIFNKTDENELNNISITHPNSGIYLAFQQESDVRDEQLIAYTIFKMTNSLKENFDLYYYTHNIFYFYIQNSTLTSNTIFLKNNLLNSSKALEIWADKTYGWMSVKTFYFWIDIILSGKFELHENWAILQNYFLLTNSQMEKLVGRTSKLYELFYIIQGVVLEKYQTNTLLYKLQWKQSISKTPLLPEIPPFDSYQNYNTSLPCYPEIGIFADPGSNINYDNLITYQNEGDINSNKASFLNFESIKLVLENSDNLNLLEATFVVFSSNDANAIVNYIKYVKCNCSMRTNLFPNNNKEIIAITNLIEPVIESPYNEIERFLLLNLTSIGISKQLELVNSTCKLIFEEYEILKNVSIICLQENFNMKTSQSNNQWILAYIKGIGSQEWNETLTLANMTNDQLNFLLYNENSTYSKNLNIVQNYFFDTYKCSNNPCTSKELAYAQWISSSITLNLPAPLFNITKDRTNSINLWNPFYFKNKIPEINAVIKNIYNISNFYIDHSIATNLFSYKEGGLFNYYDRHMFISLVESSDLSIEVLKNRFGLDFLSAKNIYNYLKYIVVEYLFEGLYVTRSAYEILYGYENNYIKRKKSTPALSGGEPKTANISLVQKNTPKTADIVYNRLDTGLDDETNSRKITNILGYNYIMRKKQYSNGNQIISFFENPWGLNENKIDGTDGFGFKPLVKQADELQIYDDQLFRNIKLESNDKEHCNQYTCLKFMISDNEFNTNPLYNTEIHGLFNMSSVVDYPLEACHPYFFNVDQAAYENIILNTSYIGNYHDLAHDMQSYYLIQPQTGVTTQKNSTFQFNLHLKRNLLLDDKLIPIEYHIPLFMENTQMKFSDERASYQFDNIITKYNTSYVIRWVCVGMCCFCFLCFLVVGFKYWQGRKQKRKNTDESLIDQNQRQFV